MDDLSRYDIPVALHHRYFSEASEVKGLDETQSRGEARDSTLW